MSLIYNRLYKVPTWIVVNGNDQTNVSKFLQGLKTAGAHEITWLSKDFPITINEMSGRGWAHEVNKPMPFFANTDFLMVAITNHLKKYGPNKTLSGTPNKPISSLNRVVKTGDDYVRIFNEVLANEPEVTLSHIFNVGELCYNERDNKKIFVSVGPVELKVLQKISDRVITIEANVDGLEIDGNGDGETKTLIAKIAQQIGYTP